MEITLGSRAVRLALRLGLAGIGLLLWHAPSAKAQECCPGEYTEAELAKTGNAAKKPVKLLANGAKGNKPAMVAKNQNAGGKDKSKNPSAQAVAMKQPVSNKKKQ